jgi:hypothetical protein
MTYAAAAELPFSRNAFQPVYAALGKGEAG